MAGHNRRSGCRHQARGWPHRLAQVGDLQQLESAANA